MFKQNHFRISNNTYISDKTIKKKKQHNKVLKICSILTKYIGNTYKYVLTHISMITYTYIKKSNQLCIQFICYSSILKKKGYYQQINKLMSCIYQHFNNSIVTGKLNHNSFQTSNKLKNKLSCKKKKQYYMSQYKIIDTTNFKINKFKNSISPKYFSNNKIFYMKCTIFFYKYIKILCS